METTDIRGLLGQGQIGQALETLLARTRQDGRYKNNLTRILEVLQAGYERTRQQELKGILSFQDAQREYNKTTDAILAILDDLEAGRVPAAALQPGRTRMLMIAGMLVLTALVCWRIFYRSDVPCPDFGDANALHILVLPFDPRDASTASVERRIQEEISSLTRKANLPAEVRIGQREDTDRAALQTAERQGRRCGADLVVFGQYKAFAQDSVRVRLGYSFLQEDGQSDDLPFQTFRDITAVVAPRDLQDALFSMCAMIAMRGKNWTFAQRWMDKIQEKEASEKKMSEWLAKK